MNAEEDIRVNSEGEEEELNREENEKIMNL